MTDFTNHADALFDTGKPVLGPTHMEARDNLQALAEGSNGGDGAPKIMSPALNPTVIANADTATLTYPVTGALTFYKISGTATGTGTYTVRYRTATDGGTTPTSWTDLVTAAFVSSDVVIEVGFDVLTLPASTNWLQIGTTTTGVSTGITSEGMAVILGGVS